MFYLEGEEPLHITWLTTALTRALKHDCKYITKWAVETSLQLEVEKLQFFGEENWGYICGPLFNALKEIHLFEKEKDMDETSSPDIVNRLRELFAKCKIAAACHDQEIPFFRKVRLLSIWYGPKLSEICIIIVCFNNSFMLHLNETVIMSDKFQFDLLLSVLERLLTGANF